MSNLAEYFAANRYKAKYEIGTRVFGYYNKIPFIGSIGNDTVISEEIGPQISVQLDLPMVIENKIRSIIIVKHKDIKGKLVSYDEDSRVQRTPTKNRK